MKPRKASEFRRWAFRLPFFMTKYIALALIAAIFSGCATAPPTCLETRGAVDLNQSPTYPPDSKKLGEQGRAILRAFVNRLGYVQDVKLRQSSGYKNLDDSAIEAVKTWCFKPATTSGKNMDAWVLVPINFTLTDN